MHEASNRNITLDQNIQYQNKVTTIKVVRNIVNFKKLCLSRRRRQ